MHPRTFTLALSLLTFTHAGAHEGVGRSGLRDPLGVEVEAEYYAGQRGYQHGGLGIILPLNERQKLGVVGHFVREETGGEIFPSLGAEFVQELGGGFELEVFGFGYLRVEEHSAWAAGLRGSRRVAFNDHVSITPFFGPAYARVRAIEEASGSAVSLGHLMLLGGVALEAGPVEFTVFGSHSFFSRDPAGVETHVDLEEMTHFAAYENNDGFARNTLGGELSYAPWDWLTLTARYALILYPEETRHSFSFGPAVKLGAHLTISAGFQLLRGSGEDNDLLMTGAGFAF